MDSRPRTFCFRSNGWLLTSLHFWFASFDHLPQPFSYSALKIATKGIGNRQFLQWANWIAIICWLLQICWPLIRVKQNKQDCNSATLLAVYRTRFVLFDLKVDWVKCAQRRMLNATLLAHAFIVWERESHQNCFELGSFLLDSMHCLFWIERESPLKLFSLPFLAIYPSYHVEYSQRHKPHEKPRIFIKKCREAVERNPFLGGLLHNRMIAMHNWIKPIAMYVTSVKSLSVSLESQQQWITFRCWSMP